MSNIEYGPLSIFDAREVRRLVRQDMVAGDFPDAEIKANPNDIKKILWQAGMIHKTPEDYLGARIGHSLKGFQKTSQWNHRNESNFLTLEEQQELIEKKEAGLLLPQNKLGIFALVASDQVSNPHREEIMHTFLDLAAVRGWLLGNVAVNIPVHGNDPLTPLLEDHGFVFSGRQGEMDGVEGVRQKLYTKTLIDTK